jgi:predicted glycosyltransferase
LKQSKLTIFICPLDWGLGHATRCIPLIKSFKREGHNVIIGSYGQSGELLKRQFPDLKHIYFPFNEIKYSRSIGMVLKMVLQFPKILHGIKRENQVLKSIVEREKPDVIISDSRLGAYHEKVNSIILIHQLIIKSPPAFKIFEPLTAIGIKRGLKKFNQVWVPDFENEPTLAGDLSHQPTKGVNIHYIGLLSRLSKTPLTASKTNILAIVSGPEPYRSSLEKKLRVQLEQNKASYTLLLGQPKNLSLPEKTIYGTIYPHLPSEKIGQLLNEASIVISRAGYSTIMDLYAVGKSAILIPTPGQTEQEYLANHLTKSGHFLMVNESDLNLEVQIPQTKKLTPPPVTSPNKQIHKLLITNK